MVVKFAELLGMKEAAVRVNSNSMIMFGGKVIGESLCNNITFLHYTDKIGQASESLSEKFVFSFVCGICAYCLDPKIKMIF